MVSTCYARPIPPPVGEIIVVALLLIGAIAFATSSC